MQQNTRGAIIQFGGSKYFRKETVLEEGEKLENFFCLRDRFRGLPYPTSDLCPEKHQPSSVFKFFLEIHFFFCIHGGDQQLIAIFITNNKYIN